MSGGHLDKDFDALSPAARWPGPEASAEEGQGEEKGRALGWMPFDCLKTKSKGFKVNNYKLTGADMKKVLLLLLAVVVGTVAYVYAEIPPWAKGVAKGNGYPHSNYLNGWTIQCGGGTYGSTVTAAPYDGMFGLSYSLLRPPAGTYCFTADSGSYHLYSRYVEYDGSSLGVDYGLVLFYKFPQPMPQ